MDFFLTNLITYWNIILFGGILAIISIGFLFHFVIPALRLGRELEDAIRQLQKIKSEVNEGNVIDLELIGSQAMKTENLKYLWSEYSETLHEQKKINDVGHEVVDRYRATVMSEAFFTVQVLVDTPLKTEFYKHLPGILTGLGILGTFTGLIQGLTQFEVSENPDAVRACLRGLIQGVGHAFYVSAAAIGMAMLFTWIEKSLVASRYRQIEKLCQQIDSFFDAGAGEEYLSRLVHASETSATQALQLKDSLVTDLKQILLQITDQQVQASAQHSQQISQNLAQAFADTMRDPMKHISDAVGRVGANQGDAVNKLLTDVLASFSSQMQDMFGGQLRGMSDLLGQTTNAMQATVAKFDQLAVNLQTAGTGAAETMAERLGEAVASMEARQGAMSTQMNQFIEQMRMITRDSQNETSQKMQTIMGELGEKVSLMVSQLEDQAKASAGNHESQLTQFSEKMVDLLSGIHDMAKEAQQNTVQTNQQAVAELNRQVKETVNNLQEMTKHTEESTEARQTAFTENSSKLLGDLTSHVDALGRRVTDAADSTKSSASLVASASITAIERMNSGAESLLLAASELSDVEKRIAATMGAMGQAAQGLQSTASTLSSASAGVQRVFDDYKATTNVFALIVTELKTTVETAKKDATLTTELVSRLQAASEKLSDAQSEAEDYLLGVTEVLGKAHESFAQNIERTLRMGNAGFHQELSNAVNILKGAIQDLGDTLDSVKR